MTKEYNDSRKLITEMKEMLNSVKSNKQRMTLEGLVYGDDEPANDQMNGAPEQTPAQPTQMAPQQNVNNNQMNGDNEPNPLDEDPEVAKLITDIRVSTLEGLRKLAQNPESAQYELLKKIFLLVDKAVEDKVNPEK